MGGNPNEVMLKLAGVPDLDNLIDIDVLMCESGLIEEYEVNSNIDNAGYHPSVNAIVRSSALASKVKRQAKLQLSRQITADITSTTDNSKNTLSTRNLFDDSE